MQLNINIVFWFSLVILCLTMGDIHVLYPWFDLPAVTGGGLNLLAVWAGIASFFRLVYLSHCCIVYRPVKGHSVFFYGLLPGTVRG